MEKTTRTAAAALVAAAAIVAPAQSNADQLIGDLNVLDLDYDVAGAESIEGATNDKEPPAFFVFISRRW